MDIISSRTETIIPELLVFREKQQQKQIHTVSLGIHR